MQYKIKKDIPNISLSISIEDEKKKTKNYYYFIIIRFIKMDVKNRLHFLKIVAIKLSFFKNWFSEVPTNI